MPGGNAGGVEGEERESYRPGPGGPFPPQTAQITRPDQVQVGDEVWAQFAGTWHKSKVLEIAGAQVKIHRLGWNAIVDRPYPLAAIRRIVGGGSAASLPAAQPVSEEKPSRKRTWTDSTGQFKVEAEFVELKDNFVSLKKSDGAVIRIPLDKLSADDQKFAQQLK